MTMRRSDNRITHFPEEQQIIESRGYTGIFEFAIIEQSVPFVKRERKKQ